MQGEDMIEADQRRPSAEQILRKVEAEHRRRQRGKLKIFLGYASGVGKSHRMFDEGRRRKERGEDVVAGAAQTEVSGNDPLIQSFETIQTNTILGAAVVDVAAILARKPDVCIIDGLAFDNPVGARNPHRWQDVEELLQAGISVLTSINIQFVKERQPEIATIRGRAVRESVPEDFIKRADEIEIVDAPAEYALTRSLTRDIDPKTLSSQLDKLREITLLLAADVVDYQLVQYMQDHGIDERYGTHERVLVCITPRSNAAVMIRRGRRQADRFHGELHVVYVDQEELDPQDRLQIEENLSVAREVDANVKILRGDRPVEAILTYARAHGITQIFVGHSQRHGWFDGLRANPVEQFILEAEGIDIRIFPNLEARTP
jgi:two-component system, OmpR family, sensor histidine kinase KdpD